ncbi:MAG: hypothetical protein K6G15_01180 [Desulfovibrio sp.]|nr:hypothetical protein [Desulfovibrio sp.]
MEDALLICPRCRHAEYVSPKFVGKKFFCHQCGNLAVVVDAENLKKFNLDKLNIKIDDSKADHKYIVNEDDSTIEANDVKEALSNKYKEMIINEINNNSSEPKEEEPELPETEQPSKYQDLLVCKVFNSFYDFLQNHTRAEDFNDVSSFCIRCSQYIIILVTSFLFISGCVFGFRSKSFDIAFLPCCLAILMCMAQYISIISFDLIDRLETKSIKFFTTEVIFKANAFFIIFAIFCIIFLAIGYAIHFTPLSLPLCDINTAYNLLMTSLLVVMLFWFLLMIFVHPHELLGLEIDIKSTISEDFLNLVSLDIKSLLKICPIIYFCGCLHMGTIALYDLGLLLVDPEVQNYAFLESKPLRVFYLNLFLPLVFYSVAIVAFFVIDVCAGVIRRLK